nr:hypothetical protein [Deltaproteobacteria bacterium]
MGRTIGEPRERETLHGTAGPSHAVAAVDARTRTAGADTAVAVVEGAIDAVELQRVVRAPRVDCIAVAIPGADTWRDTWADLARGRNAVVALDADQGR